MSEYETLTVRVHHEGDGLWAEILELPGCFASGDTFEELQDAVREAIEMYLDVELATAKWGPVGDTTEDHRLVLA